MNIRTAIAADARMIATVHVSSEQAAYRGILPDNLLDSLSVEKQEASWREHIANGGSNTLVAEKDGTILGWITFGKSRDSEAGPNIGELRAMYISPESWRCGVGSALWQQARTSLEHAGYSEVTLWVLEPNHRARRFYEKVGFKLERETHMALQRGNRSIGAVRYRLAFRAIDTL